MANEFSSGRGIDFSRMRSAFSRMLVVGAAVGWLGCGCLGPGSPPQKAAPRPASSATGSSPEDAGAPGDAGAAEARDPVAAGRALESGHVARARRLAVCDGSSDERVYLCARIAEANGEPDEALRLYGVAAGGLGPLAKRARAGRTRALVAQGRRLAGAGRNGDAVAAFEAARAAGTTSEDLSYDLACALAASGDAKKAIAILSPLAEGAKKASTMRRALGRLEELGAAPRWSDGERLKRAGRLIDRKAYEDAAELLAPLLGSDDKSLSSEATWLDARQLYERRRHYEGAAAALHEIARGKGGHADEARWLEASALSRADREPEAIAAYRKLARGKSPKAAEAEFFASRLEFYIGRYPEALAGMERLVGTGRAKGKTAPKPSTKAGLDRDRALEAHFIAGVSALLSKKAERAAKHLAAASDGEDNAEALARNRYWLAVAHAESKSADGRKALEEICAADPTAWYAEHARRRLAALGAIPDACAVAPLRQRAPARAGAIDVPLEKLSPAAALLAGIGLYGEAAEELHRAEAANGGLAPDETFIRLYLSLDAPQHAVRRASRSLAWPPAADDLDKARAAYPEPFADEVAGLEREHGLPRRLLYAIARKESLFDPDAISPSGALGMMQMMPRTYDTNRRRAGLPALAEGEIPGPHASLAAASFELEALLDRFGGSLPLAIMAYNGGATAVSHWLARAGGEPLDVFVEKAGFTETRNYVRRVYQNLVRYAQLAGDAPPALPERLPAQKLPAQKPSAGRPDDDEPPGAE
jgi:soluble lytic murein transglycosylase-like protein